MVLKYLKLEWKSGTTATRQINVHVSYDDNKYINTVWTLRSFVECIGLL